MSEQTNGGSTEGNGGDSVLGLALSPVQARLLRYAITGVGVVIIAAVVLLAFIVLRNFVVFFSSVIWPLATAGILAFLLRPLVDWATAKLRLPRAIAILLLYLLVVIVAGLMTYFALSFLLEQVVGFVQRLPEIAKAAFEELETRFPQIVELLEGWLGADSVKELRNDAISFLKNQAGSVGEAVTASGAGLATMFGTLTAAAVVPVYLYFFLETRHNAFEDVEEQLDFIDDGPREDLVFLMQEFVSIMVTFFRGQIIIALIMGFLFGIGYQIAGLKFGFFIGLATGFLNIVPYLGSIIGLSTAVPLAYLQEGGGWELVVAVVIVFAIVQVLEGYVLTPKIMGDRTGLHPVMIIVAIFFWGKALGGILGMILAIPLTAFFVVFWRLLRRNYLAQFKSSNGNGNAKHPPPEAASEATATNGGDTG
ncbi:MAG: AI-2E family transporter [Opitutales bacterium]